MIFPRAVPFEKYSKQNKPIIYCGDLNVVSSENDIYKPEILKKGRSPGTKEFERNNFKELLQKNNNNVDLIVCYTFIPGFVI